MVLLCTKLIKHVGFLKRNFFKKEISEKINEYCEKLNNPSNKGKFLKSRNSQTGEFF